jgi:hypothetical protein
VTIHITTKSLSGHLDKQQIHKSHALTLNQREKQVCLLADEIHIIQDLVFDKNANELVGFCKLGE